MASDPIGDKISQALDGQITRAALARAAADEAARHAKANIALTQPQPEQLQAPLDVYREGQAMVAHDYAVDMGKKTGVIPSSYSNDDASRYLREHPEQIQKLLAAKYEELKSDPHAFKLTMAKELTPQEVANGSTLTPSQLATFNSIVSDYKNNAKDALHTSLKSLNGADGTAVTQRLAMWAAHTDAMHGFSLTRSKAMETVMRYSPQADNAQFVYHSESKNKEQVGSYQMLNHQLIGDDSYATPAAPASYIKELQAAVDAGKEQDVSKPGNRTKTAHERY